MGFCQTEAFTMISKLLIQWISTTWQYRHQKKKHISCFPWWCIFSAMLAQAHLRIYSAEGARSRVLAAENVGYKGKISMYQYLILISCPFFFFFFFFFVCVCVCLFNVKKNSYHQRHQEQETGRISRETTKMSNYETASFNPEDQISQHSCLLLVFIIVHANLVRSNKGCWRPDTLKKISSASYKSSTVRPGVRNARENYDRV